MKLVNSYAALIIATLLVACAGQKQPAQEALDNADAAMATATAEATKYMPELLEPLQMRLAALHAAFNNHEYSAVVTDAPSVLADAQSLTLAAKQRKAQTLAALSAQWTKLAATVPSGVQTVQSKLDALSKSKRAPKDVDVATAKSDLEDATSDWSKADAANTAGNVEEAVSAGRDASGKLTLAAAAVKVTLAAPGAG